MVYSPEFIRAVKKCLPDHTELDQALAWGHSERVVELIGEVLDNYRLFESAFEVILDNKEVQDNPELAHELQSMKQSIKPRVKCLAHLLSVFLELEPVHPVCNCHPNTTVH